MLNGIRSILVIITVIFLSLKLQAFANPTPPDLSSASPKGKIFELHSNRSKVLYKFQWQEKETLHGSITEHHFINRYKDLSGNDAVIEEETMINGTFQRYSLTQYQMNELSIIERQGDKLVFWHGKLGVPLNELARSEEPWDPNFSVGALLIKQVKDNWATLTSANSALKIRMGVPERKETIGFTLKKWSETSDTIVFQMSPSSFIISALVKPMYFHFSKSDQKIISMRGRALPKINHKGEWRDLDAEIVYYTED